MITNEFFFTANVTTAWLLVFSLVGSSSSSGGQVIELNPWWCHSLDSRWMLPKLSLTPGSLPKPADVRSSSRDRSRKAERDAGRERWGQTGRPQQSPQVQFSLRPRGLVFQARRGGPWPDQILLQLSPGPAALHTAVARGSISALHPLCLAHDWDVAKVTGPICVCVRRPSANGCSQGSEGGEVLEMDEAATEMYSCWSGARDKTLLFCLFLTQETLSKRKWLSWVKKVLAVNSWFTKAKKTGLIWKCYISLEIFIPKIFYTHMFSEMTVLYIFIDNQTTFLCFFHWILSLNW